MKNLKSQLAKVKAVVRERSKNAGFDIFGLVLRDPNWCRRFFVMPAEERWGKVVEGGRAFLAANPDAPAGLKSRVKLLVCLARDKVARSRGGLPADLVRELIEVVRRELRIEGFPDRWRDRLIDYLWRFRGEFSHAIRDETDPAHWSELMAVDAELNELRPDTWAYEFARKKSVAGFEKAILATKDDVSAVAADATHNGSASVNRPSTVAEARRAEF